MARSRFVAACGAVALLWSGHAGAQTSLFDQPAAGGVKPSAVAPAEAPAAPKPKPKGPTPARALTIINASGSSLTELEVAGADGKGAKLTKALGSEERAVLRLPVLKSCMVTIKATFERAGEAETNEQNICKDKVVRLTNGPVTSSEE